MTIYEIRYTQEAELDLNLICFYIKYKLNNPIAALKITNGIINTINGLAYMPERFAIVSNNKLRKEKERNVYYKNYSIFYCIDEDQFLVTIDRIVYSKRNLEKLLNK